MQASKSAARRLSVRGQTGLPVSVYHGPLLEDCPLVIRTTDDLPDCAIATQPNQPDLSALRMASLTTFRSTILMAHSDTEPRCPAIKAKQSLTAAKQPQP